MKKRIVFFIGLISGVVLAAGPQGNLSLAETQAITAYANKAGLEPNYRIVKVSAETFFPLFNANLLTQDEKNNLSSMGKKSPLCTNEYGGSQPCPARKGTYFVRLDAKQGGCIGSPRFKLPSGTKEMPVPMGLNGVRCANNAHDFNRLIMTALPTY